LFNFFTTNLIINLPIDNQSIKKIMKFFALLFFFLATQTFSMGDSLSIHSRSTADSVTVFDSLRTNHLGIADSSATDSLNAEAVPDTVVPITFSAEYPFSLIIPQEEIRRMNLRYAGDLFSLIPVSYKRSLGFSGLPEEMNFYGAGFGNVSYFENGILLNDRMRNVYDLNLYQTEDVDSIEVVPSPRGFLHGVFNNLATVNFITKDFVAMPPYTRIKYIESPLGEGYVDAQFNSLFSKKYIFSFDVSNRKMDAGFVNTDYSLWQAKVKLKYLYSNSLNFFLGYNFVKSDIGLNGGIDYDTLATLTTEPWLYLYNERTSPVRDRESYQKVKQHNFSLRMLTHLYEESTSELSFYYRFNLDEYRQNEFGQQSGIQTFISDRKTKTLGGIVSHQTNFSIFNLSLKGNYEYVDYFERFYPTYGGIATLLSIDGILSCKLLDDKIIPSLFGKVLFKEGTNFNGVGTDLNFLLSDNSSFYTGISYFEEAKDVHPGWMTSSRTPFPTIFAAEFGYKETTDKTLIAVNLFYNQRKNTFITITDHNWSTNYRKWILPNENTYGVGLTFNYVYWKIHTLTNSTIQNSLLKEGRSSVPADPLVPSLILNWKVEYRDTLFNSSLRLRTGFEAKFSSKQAFAQYDFYEPYVYYDTLKTVPASFTLDFYLSGEIQRSAMIYFSWENLFGNTYYVTPYYPMPWRGIRFGIMWQFAN